MKKVKVKKNEKVKVKDDNGKTIYDKKLNKNKEIIASENFEIETREFESPKSITVEQFQDDNNRAEIAMNINLIRKEA